MHKLITQKNGLKIILSPIEGTKSCTVLCLVGAGSRFENKEINGISHFLEHMFFKGAKKYRNAAEVASAIDSVGGDFNAFTGKEYAGYFVKLASHQKEVAFDVIGDMMLNATFLPEEIEKERGVILEEYNMYQDTPMYQVGWDFERLLFGDQPMGWDQIGTKEIIFRPSFFFLKIQVICFGQKGVAVDSELFSCFFAIPVNTVKDFIDVLFFKSTHGLF